MKNYINVFVKAPGKDPELWRIANTLEALQKIVGGFIETVTVATDFVIICNEEGRLQGLEENCEISGVGFCGTLILAGIDGDEFDDCQLATDELRALMPQLWKAKARRMDDLDYEINHNYREGYNAGYADGLSAAWIRTAAHKPKAGAEVLISAQTNLGRVFDAAIYRAGQFTGKIWNLGAAEVSHWMPKPADPKETEGGGDA